MNAILLEVDAWVMAVVSALVMFVAWWFGWRRGYRLRLAKDESPASNLTEASLALLGLLLAFTFSLAVSKHDQRRQMVVADSNSIGDFYTCASLVKEPVRGKLQQEIRAYVEHRLTIAGRVPDQAEMTKKLAEILAMQNRMQDLVGEAVDGGTPLAIPLVNTFNEVTSNHAARLAAARDRLPAIVVLLLLMAAFVSLALVGMKHGASAEWRLGATLGFIALIAMAIWVTLDLNQPQQGVITVSQEPLERLLLGMKK